MLTPLPSISSPSAPSSTPGREEVDPFLKEQQDLLADTIQKMLKKITKVKGTTPYQWPPVKPLPACCMGTLKAPAKKALCFGNLLTLASLEPKKLVILLSKLMIAAAQIMRYQRSVSGEHLAPFTAIEMAQRQAWLIHSLEQKSELFSSLCGMLMAQLLLNEEAAHVLHEFMEVEHKASTCPTQKQLHELLVCLKQLEAQLIPNPLITTWLAMQDLVEQMDAAEHPGDAEAFVQKTTSTLKTTQTKFAIQPLLHSICQSLANTTPTYTPTPEDFIRYLDLFLEESVKIAILEDPLQLISQTLHRYTVDPACPLKHPTYLRLHQVVTSDGFMGKQSFPIPFGTTALYVASRYYTNPTYRDEIWLQQRPIRLVDMEEKQREDFVSNYMTETAMSHVITSIATSMRAIQEQLGTGTPEGKSKSANLSRQTNPSPGSNILLQFADKTRLSLTFPELNRLIASYDPYLKLDVVTPEQREMGTLSMLQKYMREAIESFSVTFMPIGKRLWSMVNGEGLQVNQENLIAQGPALHRECLTTLVTHTAKGLTLPDKTRKDRLQTTIAKRKTKETLDQFGTQLYQASSTLRACDTQATILRRAAQAILTTIDTWWNCSQELTAGPTSSDEHKRQQLIEELIADETNQAPKAVKRTSLKTPVKPAPPLETDDLFSPPHSEATVGHTSPKATKKTVDITPAANALVEAIMKLNKPLGHILLHDRTTRWEMILPHVLESSREIIAQFTDRGTHPYATLSPDGRKRAYLAHHLPRVEHILNNPILCKRFSDPYRHPKGHEGRVLYGMREVPACLDIPADNAKNAWAIVQDAEGQPKRLVSVWVSQGPDGRIFHKEAVCPRHHGEMPKAMMQRLDDISAESPKSKEKKTAKPSKDEDSHGDEKRKADWMTVSTVQDGAVAFEYVTEGSLIGWLKMTLYQGKPYAITYYFSPKPQAS